MITGVYRGAKLALSDLFHEPVMSFCFVIALAAILAPLIFLLGLKEGIVTTQLERFKEDPTNLAIRPSKYMNPRKNLRWFEERKSSPYLTWMMPSHRGMTAEVEISLGGSKLMVDLESSDETDPLLSSKFGSGLNIDEAVLSSVVADQINAEQGDTIQVTVNRMTSDGKTSVTKDLKVLKVAPRSMTGQEKIWVHYELSRGVEKAMNGLPVPLFNWEGEANIVLPEYSGALVGVEKSVPDSIIPQLQAETNLGVEKINRQDWFEIMGRIPFSNQQQAERRLPEEDSIQENTDRTHEADSDEISEERNEKAYGLKFFAINNSLRTENLEKIVNACSSHIGRHKIFGLTDNLELGFLANGNLNKVQVVPSHALDIESLVTGKGFPEVIPCYIPESEISSKELPSLVFSELGGKEFSMPLQAQRSSDLSSGSIALPARVSGVIYAMREKKVSLNERTHSFEVVEAVEEYSSFTAYAKSPAHLVDAVKEFEKNGVEVDAKVYLVENILKLEGYMAKIFEVIKNVLLLAASLALGANVLSNIQRKQSSLAFLQLLGVSKLDLIWYPLFKSLFILIVSFLFVTVLYFVFAAAVDTVMSSSLREEESFVKVDKEEVMSLITITLISTVLMSLISSLAIFRIEPSKAIRNE